MLVALTLRSTYLGQLLSVRHSGQKQQDSWRIWKQASETSGTPLGEWGSECRPAAPPSLPAGCWPPWQGWAIRSGRPTVHHILVTLHTCSTLFFSFSYLVGYHQAHLTDKLLDNNQSPTVIPVAREWNQVGQPQSSCSPTLCCLRSKAPRKQDLSLPRAHHRKRPLRTRDSPGNPEVLAVTMQTQCTTEGGRGSHHAQCALRPVLQTTLPSPSLALCPHPQAACLPAVPGRCGPEPALRRRHHLEYLPTWSQ